MNSSIPHLRIIIGFCLAAIAGYAVFSAYVVFWMHSETMIGDVIGTWKSFAVAAFMFWIGSSSGGKTQPDGPTGTKDDPLAVQGAEAGKKPVATETADKPEGES